MMNDEALIRPIGTMVWYPLMTAISGCVWTPIRDCVWESMVNEPMLNTVPVVRDSVGIPVADSIRRSLEASVKISTFNNIQNLMYEKN